MLLDILLKPTLLAVRGYLPDILILYPEKFIRMHADMNILRNLAKYNSFEQDSHPSALITRLWEKHIMLQLHVTFEDCVKELHIVSPEDRCQRQEDFCLCETVR